MYFQWIHLRGEGLAKGGGREIEGNAGDPIFGSGGAGDGLGGAFGVLGLLEVTREMEGRGVQRKDRRMELWRWRGRGSSRGPADGDCGDGGVGGVSRRNEDGVGDAGLKGAGG